MIGKIIKKLRTEKNITQSELANFLGLTPKMISFYELGERFPPYDIILKISDYFDVSTDYLLGKVSEASTISNRVTEQIISDYNSLSDENKKDFEKLLELLKIKDAKDKNKTIDEKAQ